MGRVILLAHALVFLIAPVFMEECCVERQTMKRTDSNKPKAIYRYRVVRGETFKMRCVNAESRHNNTVVWSRLGESGGQNTFLPLDGDGTGTVISDDILTFPAAEMKHSGNYTCHVGDVELLLHLQVVEKSSLGCPEVKLQSDVTLRLGEGGEIPCPAFHCGRDATTNMEVTWYKGVTPVGELCRDVCVEPESGRLLLCTVYQPDADVFFCDRDSGEPGVAWNIRRAVNVSVIPQETKGPPLIILPDGNKTQEVDLGKSHTLVCRVKFGFERNFSPAVQWYSSDGRRPEDLVVMQVEGQKRKQLSTAETLVTQHAVIAEVKPEDLTYTYTCEAGNMVGNSRAYVRLRRKTGVKWFTVAIVPIVSVVLLVGLGVVVHVKWLELSLLYRSHWPNAEVGIDEKDFDVFLSYVWSQIPSNPDDQGYGTTEDRRNTQTPLEVLLRRRLEGQWGYRLFLLERDLIPGGAYTQDVVGVIQRSRRLVCLLSTEYLCSANAVFVLESGIQALLQDLHLKLLLIWMEGRPLSLDRLDPPLSDQVRRALTVLPCLEWSPGQWADPDTSFWRSLRKAMPAQTSSLS